MDKKPTRPIKPLWLKCRCGNFVAADFPKVISYLERLVLDPEKKPKPESSRAEEGGDDEA